MKNILEILHLIKKKKLSLRRTRFLPVQNFWEANVASSRSRADVVPKNVQGWQELKEPPPTGSSSSVPARRSAALRPNRERGTQEKTKNKSSHGHAADSPQPRFFLLSSRAETTRCCNTPPSCCSSAPLAFIIIIIVIIVVVIIIITIIHDIISSPLIGWLFVCGDVLVSVQSFRFLFWFWFFFFMIISNNHASTNYYYGLLKLTVMCIT